MSDLASPLLGADLPPLGWYGCEPLDHARFEPVGRVLTASTIEGFSKPPGGLWTTPNEVYGEITLNRWVAEHGDRHSGLQGTLWEVHPGADAPFYQIDNVADLTAAIVRYPDPVNARPDRRDLGLLGCDLIDYAAMANDYAGIYLTAAGVSELNLPGMPSLSKAIRGGSGRATAPYLWAWDVPTVLFLQPAFTIGPAHPITEDVVATWKKARDEFQDAEAIRIRQLIIDEAAKQGITFPEHLLNLPAMGFVLVVSHTLREQEEADA